MNEEDGEYQKAISVLYSDSLHYKDELILYKEPKDYNKKLQIIKYF
ncbi:MAG: hypothetical protein E7J43_05245 [Finegoldia magna]|nr:hypothetical protein [Finegoldia magna]MDU1010498.1 hypothetical protein [Finegoldia magna]MDU1086908.1 hypothetical protein [Finegoldia magna]MDU7890119.1 hypothetical protein [Finegoldia magna]MDU7926290.1 hypothetical protein [Finegoldia magna]